jgi:hypothetical protein
MLNFKYNNNTVRVRFVYRNGRTTGTAALRNIHNKRITTESEISQKDQDGNWSTLAVGESVRHPKDKFIKAVGRRLALGKATKQLPDRILRKKIWDEYFNLCRDGAELMIPEFDFSNESK